MKFIFNKMNHDCKLFSSSYSRARSAASRGYNLEDNTAKGTMYIGLKTPS